MSCRTQARQNQREVLEDLDRLAPGVPLLALGQTIFWDEPMKGGVALALQEMGSDRTLVAGIHDTDYFARLPGGDQGAGYAAFPHNDTTTQALWSAAGEFSSLFGSETVITKDLLAAAGVRVAKVHRERPGHLDHVTEAFGWRGVVRLGDHTQTVAETPIGPVFRALFQTLQWAVDQTLSHISGHPERAREAADGLLDTVCKASESATHLSDFYHSLAETLYSFAAGQPVPLATTRTTELLRFNRSTAHLARFDLVERFLNPNTRDLSRDAYDQAVRGTEMYTLDRFGTGALPFDLVIPGLGRGTLRVGHRGIVVMTPVPQFITLRRPISTLSELAEAIERRFGTECVLVGKAVTLVGMLAKEFVFVFHEGASGYIPRTRALLQRLYAPGEVHPVLRVRYSPWDTLEHCCQWFRLPSELASTFGAEELCAPSLAARWHQVQTDQETRLTALHSLRRPIDFIRWLAAEGLGSWEVLAAEYEGLHDRLNLLREEVDSIRRSRGEVWSEAKALKAKRNTRQNELGDHWRAAIFEKDPTSEELAERERRLAEIRDLDEQIAQKKAVWSQLHRDQEELTGSPEIMEVHARRRQIELEAELKRIKLVRQAVIATKGLCKAGYRPSAWWFPLVCPDGTWFKETTQRATYYLESLT